MLRHVLPPKLQTKKKYDEINMKKNNHVNLTVIQKQHWEKQEMVQYPTTQ